MSQPQKLTLRVGPQWTAKLSFKSFNTAAFLELDSNLFFDQNLEPLVK